MASNIANLGGYECDFVEAPPDELLCLICTFVAREPMQMDCCGKVYCKACLTELKKRSNKCPNCRSEGSGFPDRRSERNIKALRVKCGNLGNGCAWVGELGCLIPNHRNSCPFEQVACKYSTIGCEEKLIRRDRKGHEIDEQLHLHIAMETILLQERRHWTQAQAGGGTHKTTFKMAKFSQYKESGQLFYSSPFYTHQGGYKIRMRVDANGCGDGAGTHVSVFACLMRGENDDNLIWPFTGDVTVELLNQLADKEHQRDTIPYPEGRDDEYNSRVVDGERGPDGLGRPTFISYADLGPTTKRQFLKDDCLYFRVSVKATPNPKPWLTCTS